MGGGHGLGQGQRMVGQARLVRLDQEQDQEGGRPQLGCEWRSIWSEAPLPAPDEAVHDVSGMHVDDEDRVVLLPVILAQG